MSADILEISKKENEMDLYRDEISMMDEGQLWAVLKNHKIDCEREVLDMDDVIELLEYHEGKVYESIEDDILDTIFNGNWTDGAKQMVQNHITPNALVDYIENYRFENIQEAYEWFDLSSAVAITQLYLQARGQCDEIRKKNK